jgi:phage baseplate assembly protein V
MNQLFTRLMLLIGRGRFTTVNDSGVAQMVQARMGAIELKDNIPRIAEFGFTSNPPIGSDAVVAFIGGNRDNGVIVATGHQASRPTGLHAGETMLYSQDGKYIYLTASGGIVINANDQPVTINDATTVTINAATQIIFDTPLVATTGNLTVGTGVSGSFTTPAGNVVTVQDGIVTNIE